MIRDYFRTRDASNPAKPWHEISCEDRFFFEGGSATGVSVREAIEHHSAMCCGTGGTRCGGAAPPAMPTATGDSMCMHQTEFHAAKEIFVDTHGTKSSCQAQSDKVLNHFRSTRSDPALPWSSIGCEERFWVDEAGVEMSVREAISHRMECCGASGMRCGGAAAAPPATPGGMHDHMMCSEHEWRPAHHVLIDAKKKLVVKVRATI